MAKITRPMREDTKVKASHKGCDWFAWVLPDDKEAEIAAHVKVCGTAADPIHGPAARLFDV